jgi:spore germination protein YaaH
MSDHILSGWYYPSAPCWPRLDLVQEKYRGINQLCGEFLRFSTQTQEDGSCIEIMTEQEYGNGGYTPENIEQLKSIVEEPYCTISGRSDSGVSRMLNNETLIVNTINKIVNFCKENGLNVDINIEGLASFTEEECQKHVDFLNRLGEKLKSENIKYRVVTVAEDGSLFHGNWRNDFLRNVTCDYIVCMQYDRMYDYGRVGISPIDFLRKTTENMKKSIGEDWEKKYICGLPNYGYKAYIDNQWWIELVTTGQLAKQNIGISNERDPNSFEAIWESVGTVRNKPEAPIYYFYSDQYALDEKTKIMLELGVNKFCLWHSFGGKDQRDNDNLNPWWSDEVIDMIIEETPVEPPIEPRVEPPVEPPIEPPVEPPIEPPVEPPIESVITRMYIEDIKITDRKQINKIINNIKRITNNGKINYELHYSQ